MVTKETFKPSGGDVMDPETKVERAGYMSAKVQVGRLIQAGRALSEYRRELYDFGPDEVEDPDFTDPTRDPNFDLADAHVAMQELAKRKKVYKANPEKPPVHEVVQEPAKQAK